MGGLKKLHALTVAEMCEHFFHMPTQSSDTVLLVEDRGLIRDILAEALEGEGYTVQTAPNAFEALRHVQTRAPQAVVLDLILLGMNGWDFIDAVRQILNCLHTPIMVMSAACELHQWAAGLREREECRRFSRSPSTWTRSSTPPNARSDPRLSAV